MAEDVIPDFCRAPLSSEVSLVRGDKVGNSELVWILLDEVASSVVGV